MADSEFVNRINQLSQELYAYSSKLEKHMFYAEIDKLETLIRKDERERITREIKDTELGWTYEEILKIVNSNFPSKEGE